MCSIETISHQPSRHSVQNTSPHRQSVSQSVSVSVSQSVNQSVTKHSVIQSVSQSVSQSLNSQSVSQSFSQSVGQSLNSQSVTSPNRQPIIRGELTAVAFSRSFYCLPFQSHSAAKQSTRGIFCIVSPSWLSAWPRPDEILALAWAFFYPDFPTPFKVFILVFQYILADTEPITRLFKHKIQDSRLTVKAKSHISHLSKTTDNEGSVHLNAAKRKVDRKNHS